MGEMRIINKEMNNLGIVLPLSRRFKRIAKVNEMF
jgi:hypothetical protein